MRSRTALVFMICTCVLTHAAGSEVKGSGSLEPGLVGRDDIIFFTDFESADWRRDWGHKEDGRSVTLASDPGNGFEPLSGKALRVQVSKGKHYGTSFAFKFKQALGTEPESVYFRYYLRFANNWKPEGSGKLPGIAGTYGKAGWGGRRANGRNGWSARGLFTKMHDGKTPIGFYPYHADMGRWGANWKWNIEERGHLVNNRWYCVEQFVQLNTPGRDGGNGKHDGIMRGWIDGKLAFEKTDIRMRDISALKIEKIWIDVYYGGSWTPKHDMHIYMDNMVIASGPIGPRQFQEPSSGPAPKPKVEHSTAQPDTAVVEQYRQQLKQMTQRQVNKKLYPRFKLDVLKAEVEISAVDKEDTHLRIPKMGSSMTLNIWETMTAADCSRLAGIVARRNNQEDQAVQAFFLLVSGDRAQAQQALRRAGAHADAVRQHFRPAGGADQAEE